MLKDDNNLYAGSEDYRKYKVLENQINNLLHMDETICRQGSRAVRLKGRDRNSKFFHGKANKRRKTNLDKKLNDDIVYWSRGDNHYEIILIN